MNDFTEKFIELRKRYPGDIEQIKADERRLSDLLEEQEYYQQPGTQKLVALCRTEIKDARLKLAMDRELSPEATRELWAIIDARLWFLKLVSKDFNAELAQLGGELDAELEKDA